MANNFFTGISLRLESFYVKKEEVHPKLSHSSFEKLGRVKIVIGKAVIQSD
jgi:hypothetical protein